MAIKIVDQHKTDTRKLIVNFVSIYLGIYLGLKSPPPTSEIIASTNPNEIHLPHRTSTKHTLRVFVRAKGQRDWIELFRL